MKKFQALRFIFTLSFYKDVEFLRKIMFKLEFDKLAKEEKLCDKNKIRFELIVSE